MKYIIAGIIGYISGSILPIRQSIRNLIIFVLIMIIYNVIYDKIVINKKVDKYTKE
jgi:hypothetical protein